MQLNLFDPEPLPVGAIVIKARALGDYCYWPPQVPERKFVLYPYWQIRFLAHPGYEVIKREKNVTTYGEFHMELPGAPLQYCCAAVPYGEYLSYSRWFHPADIIDTGLRWRVPTWDEIQNVDPAHYARSLAYKFGPPYPFETELVAMLETLNIPWQYGAVTEDNYKHHTLRQTHRLATQ